MQTAINEEVCSVDVARIVRSDCESARRPQSLRPVLRERAANTWPEPRSQVVHVLQGLTEDDRLGLLDSLAKSAHGVMDHPPVELFGRVQEVHEQGRSDRAAAMSISPDEKSASTHGQRALKRMPSRAWTMASSRVMARTAPFEAVSAGQPVQVEAQPWTTHRQAGESQHRGWRRTRRR